MELKTYFAQDAAGNIISSAIVNVFLQGTTTLATGLTRADGTPLENPFAADGAGRIQFRAPDGYYDVQVSAGPGIIQTLTIQCVDYSGAKADADRAEAAASLADVSAEQAQNALNSITGINTNFEQNSREQWRRSLAEAGLTLVSGSFEGGATASTVTDAVWHIEGGQCYTWGGAFPKTVPENSTPGSTGGISAGAWVSTGGKKIKASSVETNAGETMQSVTDAQNKKLALLNSPHRKRVAAAYAWVFPDYNDLLAAYNYSQMVPQGVALDDTYIYSLYWTGGSSATNHWTWVAVWNRQTQAYVSCFYLPSTLASSYSEGGYIRNISGSKVLYTEIDGVIRGYNITELPANKGTPATYGSAIGSADTFESFGAGPDGIAVIQKGTNHRGVVMLDWSGAQRGRLTLSPIVDVGGADNSSVYDTSKIKIQARTLGNSMLYLFGGGQYSSTTANKFPMFASNFMRVGMDGTTKQHYAYDPHKFIRALTGLGESVALGVVECEGATTAPDGRIYSQWYYEISSPYSINMLLIEEDSIANDAVDLSSAAVSVMSGWNDADMFLQSFDTSNIYNPYTGVKLASLNDVCEMMRNARLNRVNVYCSGSFPIYGTNIVPDSTMVNLYRVNGNTIFMQLTGPTFQRTITSTNSGQFTYNKFQIGGQDTDTWFGTGDFVIAGFNGLGVMASRRAGTAASIHYRFQNDNGVVGTIQTTGATTVYGTTSDETLKTRVSEIDDADRLIRDIVEHGAVAKAYFNADPKQQVSAMFMAQTLQKIFPAAVTDAFDMDDGSGQITRIPMNVDYARIAPYLVQAIYNLAKRLDELENK